MCASARITTLIVLALAIVIPTSTGCGGGGGDGNVVSAACFVFEPGAAPGSGRVTLRSGSGSTCDVQRLDVLVNDVLDVFAASFKVVYDPNLMTFNGYSLDGSLLASGGAQVEAIVTDVPGVVTVGLSRVAPATGVDVGATRTVVVLIFTRYVTPTTSCPVYFEDAALLGSEAPPVAKTGIEWFGGVLRVQ